MPPVKMTLMKTPLTIANPVFRWPARLLLLVLGCALLRADGNVATYNFAPFAGAPALLDHTNGAGTNARFLNPNALAVDASGNVYVADTGDHTVRRVSPGGEVTTFAGASGVVGSADGGGGSARFTYPAAAAVDGAGNVYIADMGNNTVRKITPGGVVTTLADASIGLNAPQGIAVDALGTVYVADTDSHVIRKIVPNGGVSVFAGAPNAPGGANGSGASARFNLPSGLAIDASGNLFVADFGNSTIRKITPAGVVSTVAGKAGVEGVENGSGSAARFDHPGGVAVDSAGTLYVSDTNTQTIRKITPEGVVSTLAGAGYSIGRVDGSGASARFAFPFGIAVLGSGTGAAVYVADRGNHGVRRIAADGGVSTLAGGAGVAGSADGSGSGATFFYPYGLDADSSGNVYVADRSNNTIRKIAPGGAVTTLAGTAGESGSQDGTGAAARFNDPFDVAVDGNGNVFVADRTNHTIRKITPAGVVTTFAGRAGAPAFANGSGGSARFKNPQGVATDSAGNVYVADTGNQVIRKITPSGVVSTLAGAAGKAGSTDGTGSAARFSSPFAVAVGSSGNVYVSDFNNSTIRKITSAGVVTTLAGQAGQEGLRDGTGSAARFFGAYDLAVDPAGNVLATDTFNHVVRLITPTGGVTTLTGAQARFFYPQGIAVDNSGNVYVADGDNHSISRAAASTQITADSSTRTVALGGSVTFSVTATGGSFSYQWFRDGEPIAGANGSSYTIASVTEADAGDYQVQVGSFLVDAGSLVILPSNNIGGDNYAIFTRGVPGQHQFLRAGTTTWKASGLPSWAKLNSKTGLLTANPTSKAKTAFITVTAVTGTKPYPTLRFALIVRAALEPDFALTESVFAAAAPGRTLNGITFVDSTNYTRAAVPGDSGLWNYSKTEPNIGVLTLQNTTPEPDTFAGMDLVYSDPFSGWAINYDIVDNDPVNYTFTAFDLKKSLVPAGIAASDGTFNDKVQITWDAEPWATGYRVYRYTTLASATAGKSTTAISGKNPVLGTTFDDLKASPGKTYYYRVAAVRGGVTGGQGEFDAGHRFVQSTQTISFPAPTKMTEGDDPLLLLPTASSGLPVTLTVVSGPATLDEHVLTVTGPGKVVIRATQEGSFEYKPAKAVSKTITVARAAVTP